MFTRIVPKWPSIRPLLNQTRGIITPTEPQNFSWLIKEKLAGMACPKSDNDIQYLREAGIRHVVTLSQEAQPPDVTPFELQHYEISIPEFEGPSLSQTRQFVTIVKQALEKNEPVAVHCRVGRGRTGTMLACFVMFYMDKPPTAAVQFVRTKRPGSIETREQLHAIENFYDWLKKNQERSKV